MELTNEFFGSLVGAVVGSAFAGFGFIYKRSSEQKEEIRRVIFFLLQMHGFLRLTEVFSPRNYIEACEKVAVDLGYEETKNKEEMFKVVEPLIKPQIEEAMKDIGQWNGDEYIQSLNIVARYDPVVAYRLRSNSLLKTLVPQMRVYWARYLDVLGQHGLPRGEAEKNIPEFEIGMLKHIRSELCRDMLSLARSVSYIEFLKLKKAIRSYESRDIEAAIEPFFRKILSDQDAAGK